MPFASYTILLRPLLVTRSCLQMRLHCPRNANLYQTCSIREMARQGSHRDMGRFRQRQHLLFFHVCVVIQLEMRTAD